MSQPSKLEIQGTVAAQLLAEKASLSERFAEFVRAKLSLDMTRGKPSPEQLDLALGMLSVVGERDYRSADGTDCRNYGGLDGLPESKTLLAPLLEVAEDELIVGGNSSLTLMHDSVARGLSHGVPGGRAPWSEQGPVKFLCPAPGYDRHFAILEHFGIEMISVPMLSDGPDMDEVEKHTRDPQVKGLWLVPRYGNPSGITVSAEVVERLARMQAAPDFRLFWDNAYSVHHLVDDPEPLANILEACKAAGVPDRPFLFASTSKISFAGSGLALMGGSRANLDWMRRHLSKLTIGPDKLNQLRHVRFFGNFAGIEAHMKRHAALLRPKFECVDRVLSEALPTGLARFSKPRGGYFVSFDTLPGCARRVVELAGEAGVKLTAAGATFPYSRDPNDQNIRIAPTLPSLAEIEQAMQVFCVCVRLATLERLDQNR